jgi:dUTP pyrophosphatase
VTRVPIRIARVRPDRDSDLPLPKAATPGSVGLDLCAAIEAECVLQPGDRAAVPTGIAVAIPRGYEGQVRGRSGLARRHGLTLPNAPGTIDSDYRGEIQVLLLNAGREPVVIHRGDRIAQLIVGPVVTPEWEEVESVEALGATHRGPDGFGHSGR